MGIRSFIRRAVVFSAIAASGVRGYPADLPGWCPRPGVAGRAEALCQPVDVSTSVTAYRDDDARPPPQAPHLPR